MAQRTWSSTVVEHHRLREDLAVVRLVGDVVPFRPGQYVDVSVPQNSRLLRRLSPALPPSHDGKLEFHVKTVPGGWVSGSIVKDTQPGDVWQILDPRGNLSVDENGPTVIMVAGGTGLAPLRSIILDLAQTPNPRRCTSSSVAERFVISMLRTCCGCSPTSFRGCSPFLSSKISPTAARPTDGSTG